MSRKNNKVTRRMHLQKAMEQENKNRANEQKKIAQRKKTQELLAGLGRVGKPAKELGKLAGLGAKEETKALRKQIAKDYKKNKTAASSSGTTGNSFTIFDQLNAAMRTMPDSGFSQEKANELGDNIRKLATGDLNPIPNPEPAPTKTKKSLLKTVKKSGKKKRRALKTMSDDESDSDDDEMSDGEKDLTTRMENRRDLKIRKKMEKREKKCKIVRRTKKQREAIKAKRESMDPRKLAIKARRKRMAEAKKLKKSAAKTVKNVKKADSKPTKMETS